MMNNSTPLTPAVFHILLSLASSEKHGYEIMKQVKKDSNNSVSMGNGTLYGSLKRMLDDRLIEMLEQKNSTNDERRKYYRLTSLGRKMLTQEMNRYVETVKIIRAQKLLQSI